MVKAEEHLNWYVRALGAAFGFTLFVTAKLWISNRDFPLVPYFSFLPTIEPPVDYILYMLMIAGSALLMLYPEQRKYASVLAIALAILMLFDQMRWHPVFVHFLLIFGLIGVGYKKPDRTLAYIALSYLVLLGGICINMFTINYHQHVFPWLAKPVLNWFPLSWHAYILKLSFGLPLFGLAALGCMFLAKKQKIGIYAAVGFFAYLMWVHSPLGNDFNMSSAVYYGFAAFSFFWLFRPMPSWSTIINKPYPVKEAVLFAFFALAPLLSFVGLWDENQAFRHYSGKSPFARIVLNNIETDSLPEKWKKHVKTLNGTAYIELAYWSSDELDIPVYSQARVFKQIKKKLCAQINLEGNCPIELVIYGYNK